MKALTKLRIEQALKNQRFDPLDESISADEWARKRNAELAKKKEEPPSVSALMWLEESQNAASEISEVWKERYALPATNLMLALINVGDSPEDIQMFRQLIPVQYDIARERDDQLLTLRDELRAFWDEAAKEQSWIGPTGKFGDNVSVALSLRSWWNAYDLSSDGWYIFWESGSFFPTPKNFRGTIARVLFERRRFLALCDVCKRYWIKGRTSDKICGSPGCKRYGNKQRVEKHYKKHGRKSVRSNKRRNK